MKTKLHFLRPRRGWQNWTKHLAWLLPAWVAVAMLWHGAVFVAAASGLQKVTVRVTDFETGEPLEGVEVKSYFAMKLPPGQGWGFGTPVEKNAHTDKDGICCMSAMADGDNVVVESKPEGFYRFERRLLFTNVTWETPPRFLPWNPVLELRLNRKGTPVPMFAKHLKGCRIPEMDSPCGYDLEAGDWVAPFGKGKTSDILFAIHREEVKGEKPYGGWLDPHPYEGVVSQMDVEFPGAGNGIIPVLLPEDTFRHFLRTAPESGYEPRLTRKGYYACPSDDEAEERGWMPNQDRCFYLRVRTQLDEKGNVVSAHYGKIYRDFKVEAHPGTEGGFGDFSYYFNPVPNDRNIEFGENLFKNLDVLRYEKAFLFP